jgi:hypothetical protein
MSGIPVGLKRFNVLPKWMWTTEEALNCTIAYFLPIVLMGYMCARISYEVHKMRQEPGFSDDQLQVTVMLLGIISLMIFSRSVIALPLFIYKDGIIQELKAMLNLLNSSVKLIIYHSVSPKFWRIFWNRFQDIST